jgi:hypothetical protein
LAVIGDIVLHRETGVAEPQGQVPVGGTSVCDDRTALIVAFRSQFGGATDKNGADKEDRSCDLSERDEHGRNFAGKLKAPRKREMIKSVNGAT